MQMDLFDETWVFMTAGLYGVLFYKLVHRLFAMKYIGQKAQDPRRNTIVVIGLGAGIFAELLYLIIAEVMFRGEELPKQIVLWAIPLGVAVMLWTYSLWLKSSRKLAVMLIAPALLLGLLAANNWWHYYPSLSALVASDPAIDSKNTESEVSTRYKTPLETYYRPLENQPQKGVVQSLSIPNRGTFHPRSGYIYLPPALHRNTSLRLPVIVLLAGHPGQPSDWINNGLAKILDDYAIAHHGLAPIVAGVDFTGVDDVDTECVDSRIANVETYLKDVVPSYLKTHYQVSLDANLWTIGGFSAGGTCSSMVAVRNPNVYRSYLNIAGDPRPNLTTPAQTLEILFNNSNAAQSAHDPTLLFQKNKTTLYREMNAWYFFGNHDSGEAIADIKHQTYAAQKAGVNVVYREIAGNHGFYVWKQGFEQALPWLMKINALSK